MDYSTRKCCNSFEHYKEYSKYSTRTSNAYLDIWIHVCWLYSHTPSYIQTYLHNDISACVHLYQYILSYIHAHGFLYTHIHIHNYTKTFTYKNTYSYSHIYEVTYTSTVPLHIPLHTHKHSYFITCLCWNTYAGSSDLTHLFAHTSTGDQMHSLQILPLQTLPLIFHILKLLKIWLVRTENDNLTNHFSNLLKSFYTKKI